MKHRLFEETYRIAWETASLGRPAYWAARLPGIGVVEMVPRGIFIDGKLATLPQIDRIEQFLSDKSTTRSKPSVP